MSTSTGNHLASGQGAKNPRSAASYINRQVVEETPINDDIIDELSMDDVILSQEQDGQGEETYTFVDRTQDLDLKVRGRCVTVSEGEEHPDGDSMSVSAGPAGPDVDMPDIPTKEEVDLQEAILRSQQDKLARMRAKQLQQNARSAQWASAQERLRRHRANTEALTDTLSAQQAVQEQMNNLRNAMINSFATTPETLGSGYINFIIIYSN